MAWRGTALSILAIAGLLVALKEPGLVLQGFVLVSFAMLGVFAALVARRNGRWEPSQRERPRLPAALRDLRRLVTLYRRDPLADLEVDRATIEEDPWADEEQAVPHRDDPGVARELIDRLAPPAVDPIDDLGPWTHEEFLAELLREGEDLRSLGRLVKVDLGAYTTQLANGLAAARAGRYEECGLSLQLANQRLRGQLQDDLAKEWPTLRSSLSFGRR
jgi:hypothetical protein